MRKKGVKNKPLRKVSKQRLANKPSKKKINRFSISERAKRISEKISLPKLPEKKIIKEAPPREEIIPTIKKETKKEMSSPAVSPIKSMLRLKKIPTGIPGYDEMTKGGFEDQSINLIAGGSGTGKSIFSLQFLLEGLRGGERVLYITFEENKEDFYNYMKDFAWDLQKAEDSGTFFFLEYSPEKVKQMLDEGGGTIENMVLKYKVTRIVIDSLTSFSLMFDDELSKRKSILGLFDILRKWDCTTLLTVQHNPRSREDRGISPSEFEADSITLLYYLKIGSRRERFIEVLKMRGEDHSKEMHSFTIKKGIQIGPVARSKPF